MMLWGLSIAIPALLALGAYRLAATGETKPAEIRDARTAAIMIFLALFALTALHNLIDDGIESDPYHGAKSAFEAH